MRSPADMDIIQIEVTNACHLRCSNCTRLVAHQAKPFVMDLETFRAAVESMKDWYRPGKILGVMGGEPTLHPRFAELAELFYEIWGVRERSPHGRGPIADFNAYVGQRLRDRTSGRGLWTSLGKGYAKHYEVIQEVFDHQTVNTHENEGRHQAILITRKEMGIPDEEWFALRDKCWVQETWSASITPSGAYFCEVAAALDLLYNHGANAWPIEPGWWRRTPGEFGKQLELCELCALALPGPSQQANRDRDQLSPLHVEKLKKVKSPAVVKGNYDSYPECSGAALENRVDRYLPGADRRVGENHGSILPRRIDCVVTSIGRWSDLAATLPLNAGHFDRVIVVTSPEDDRTIGIAEAIGGNVVVVATDAHAFGESAFNKGAMINAGLEALGGDCDWIVMTDSDIIMDENLGRWLRSRALNPGCLYYTKRIDVHRSSRLPVRESQNAHLSNEPNGYFHLFNPRARALAGHRWPNLMPTCFASAGVVDSWFQFCYAPEKKIAIDRQVLHLYHDGGVVGRHWNGAPKGRCWRQCGIVTVANGFVPVGDGLPQHDCRLRLVDLKECRVAEIDFPCGSDKIPQSILHHSGTDLIFQGAPLGGFFVAVYCYH